MVLATVGAWYVGDVIYNDFERYVMTIGSESIASAWWQVLWFLAVFGVAVVPVHQWMNRKYLRKGSHVMAYLETRRLWRKDVQGRIDKLAAALLVAWLVLMAIALVQVHGDVLGLFAPYLGHKANPWSRGQIGGGYSAFISLASYLQIFLTAAFGVVAAVSMNAKTRRIALAVCFLMLPWYVFDRTRNTMLATVLPGLLSWVFLRLRMGFSAKLAILGVAFLMTHLWFSLVMANREGMQFNIGEALSGQGLEGSRHAGLNMFEELAWIDKYIELGSYNPNWGERYFAEVVNPIPRAIWENKPTIGLDYAMARGQAVSGPNGETTATISTGMIGQGVVNFGRFFGPMAAALLMTLWVGILARQDLLGRNPGRLILYGCGLILTFNLGRDITLLVLYPFFFGWGLYRAWLYYQRYKAGGQMTRKARGSHSKARDREGKERRKKRRKVVEHG
ncbi:MAG: hypothetical protein KJO21_12335 [Verrucomicrobiae bacterium]|nr:hypothetical protein [Verrucomicrobiae bacterium]NNJ44007.1 hypothetical protein [Akkermansiaceae bacterium]